MKRTFSKEDIDLISRRLAFYSGPSYTGSPALARAVALTAGDLDEIATAPNSVSPLKLAIANRLLREQVERINEIRDEKRRELSGKASKYDVEVLAIALINLGILTEDAIIQARMELDESIAKISVNE